MTKIFDMNDVARIARAWADLDGKLQEYEADQALMNSDSQSEFGSFLEKEYPTYDGYWAKTVNLLEKAYGPNSVRLIEVIMH